MKKLLILITFSISGIFVYSQNTTSRLTIESGGSLNFYFNSLQKYQNGIKYTGWTRLRIYYNDTTVTGGIGIDSTWRLDVKALNSEFNGDAGNTLDLNTLELEATGVTGVQGIKALSNSDVSLITKGVMTAPGTVTVFITYYCGQSKTVSNNLLGEKPDYYYVDIVFTLGPD